MFLTVSIGQSVNEFIVSRFCKSSSYVHANVNSLIICQPETLNSTNSAGFYP